MFPYIRIYIYIYICVFMCTYRRCMSSTTTAGKCLTGADVVELRLRLNRSKLKDDAQCIHQGFPSIHICSLQHSSDSVHR